MSTTMDIIEDDDDDDNTIDDDDETLDGNTQDISSVLSIKYLNFFKLFQIAVICVSSLFIDLF